MHVFYLVPHSEKPETGGEYFSVKAFNYLKKQNNIELIIPSKADFNMLKRPYGCLGINLYFLNRFQQLSQDTIVVESENYFMSFFLVNWIIKLFRRDIHFLINARQKPDPLLYGLLHVFRTILAFLFFRSGHSVTVNSQYLKNELSSIYGVPRRRIHVVYSSGNTLGQSNIRFADNVEIHLLCVAHIRPLKGQEVLIKALHRLHNNRVKLSMVGGTKDKNYELKMKSLVEELGLVKQVQLVGRLEGDDLSKAYQEADIFILPSLYEAFGIAVQEAMSFGLTIIATNIGGIPEQIRDGIDGLLVPPGDPDALAKALQALIDNPDLRISMGKSGRKRLNELPTWDDVCERFYQALIGLSKDR